VHSLPRTRAEDQRAARPTLAARRRVAGAGGHSAVWARRGPPAVPAGRAAMAAAAAPPRAKHPPPHHCQLRATMPPGAAGTRAKRVEAGVLDWGHSVPAACRYGDGRRKGPARAHAHLPLQ